MRMTNIKESVAKTYETLAELRQLDVQDWSDETKQEMEAEVDEVIKMALATKLKLQRASLNQFLDILEQQDALEVATLENAIKYMDTMLTNIQSLAPVLKKAG